MTNWSPARITLAAEVGANGELPTEFRLFVQGWNDTSKGRFLFDKAAAKAVMADRETRGVDVMIDLEHQSLNGGTPPEATARDARGWCALEVRADGSLWAVNVRWTPDGKARLSEGRQKYVSPAFAFDKSKRVLAVLNIALVAMPATHETPALVAAAERGGPMTIAEFLKVCVALGLDPDKTTMAEAQAKITGQDAEDDPAQGGDSGADETTEVAADPPAPAAAPAPAPEKKEVAAAAAVARVMVLTGAKTLTGAVEQVETFRTSHITLAAERKRFATERAVLEADERVSLGVEMVTKLGVAPAAVWIDALADEKSRKLKPRWERMSLSDLREHVTDLRASGTRAAVNPPTGPAVDPQSQSNAQLIAQLSAEEVAICTELKADLADYARLKSVRDGKTAA